MAEPRKKKLTFPSLVISQASLDPPSMITNIGLIEIASAFGVSIALAGQVRSISSAFSIIAALAMGILSVRYSYKTLLLAGLSVYLVSVVCCGFVPSFMLLIVCFSVLGLVTSIVTPMVYTYVGELYPVETRSKMVGALVSLRSISYLLMLQLVRYSLEHSGWRLSFLIIVAPLGAIALLLSRYTLPDMRSQSDKSNILEGYKAVLSSRSALSCLIANTLTTGAWGGGVTIYMVSYLRERLLLSLSTATSVYTGHVICVTIGNYLAGYLIKQVGLKRLAVISAGLEGVLIFAYMNVYEMIPLLVIIGLMCVVTGVLLTCKNAILLTQVPSYRGTVTSLNSAALQLGLMLGIALGGILLTLYGWTYLGITYGTLTACSALFYHFGVKLDDD